MGLTVAQVIERTSEEVLEAGGLYRPSFDVLEGAITDSAMSLTTEGRLDDIPPDSLIEFYDDTMEVAETKAVVGTAVTLQTRGYLGTTAAAHADGVKLVLDNPFPRQVIFNALRSVLSELLGYGLYAKGYVDTLTVVTSAPVVLPAGAIDVLDPILQRNGTTWGPLVKGSQYRVFHNFTGPDTPAAIQFLSGSIAGAATKIFYKKAFDTDPFTLSTDLGTVGVPTSLQHHLSLGVAGHLLQGRDVPVLDSAGEQTGKRMSIGRALWQSFVSGPVTVERVKQLEANPITTVF